jgi:hypothetical protein
MPEMEDHTPGYRPIHTHLESDLDVVARGLATQIIEDDSVGDVVIDCVAERYPNLDPEDEAFVDREDEIVHELLVKVATQLILAANGFAVRG